MEPTLRPTPILLAAALAWLLIAPPSPDALAADWPQWLGPDHNGVTPESSGYPAGWPPARLWSKNVGKGCTSPILAGGHLYVMGWSGGGGGNPVGTDSLLCLDARTGAEVWRRTYPCRYQSRIRTGDTEGYGGPSSTPTFDPETAYLYTLSIDGHLCCWDTKRQGAPVWGMNFHDAYQIPQRPDVGKGKRDYGHPGSPLLVGNQVIVEVGDDSGTVMAFDKTTGRRVWTSQATELGGHSGGPTPFVVDGVPCLATLALRKVIVMRLDKGHEGRTVGEFPWTTDFANNIATPAARTNQLVISSDYNVSRMALLEVSLKGGIRETWRVRDHSKVCSPVIHKGRIFTVDGTLKCLDLATGRRIWSGGQFGHGSVLVTAGDDRIIAFGKGGFALLDALGGAYRELGRVDRLFRSTCYPHVTLAGGVLAVKDMDGNLICFDVQNRATGAAAPKPGPAPKPPPPPATGGPSPHDAKAPAMTGTWPGNTDGLVFLWADAKANNAVTDAAGKTLRTCSVTPRAGAKTNAGGEMVLGKGAMLAEGADQTLLEACKASRQLAVEALITPQDLKQGGPARIISFSEDGYHRNFTVCQEREQLLLRLRTSGNDLNGMRPQTNLLRLAAGKTHHVIVSYAPGRLVGYLDGKRVCDTGRVTGDFSNWDPMHLLFGDEWKDPRLWTGRLSGIAIHSRVIGAEEAAGRYALAMKRLNDSR